ncbi:transcriptional regulator [Desulfitobacterium dichloroeliminans LMG P-21439]|uniref:Transcriptional regulator n=1 Tax=Desulfitobacterium dichloroeliminans (strain LMG P-21439 / DCA1) TaxID=871963 RepID=L0F7V9_DESDL|nr:TetR/AcrR family transcriptional regulator C-terminal domain-containing protein [Desulfitobacterium dichloroeliminans]AGA69287.1 transcriptional regulator [Desulfitobacterium dichloroeliminans LMG P-21439]
MLRNHITKKIIYDSLCELLNEKSMNKITVNDILVKSKCSRSTFYRHFKDKYDLMNWFYKYHVEQLFINGTSMYEVQLNIIKFYDNNRKYFQSILNFRGQNSFRDFVHRNGEELIKDFVKKKINANELSQDVEFAIKMFNYGAFNMAIEWLNNNFKLTPEEFNRQRCDNMPQILKDLCS